MCLKTYLLYNRYLVADQIKGPTTEQGYARALRSGCRCVERKCFHGPGEDVLGVIVPRTMHASGVQVLILGPSDYIHAQPVVAEHVV